MPISKQKTVPLSDPIRSITTSPPVYITIPSVSRKTLPVLDSTPTTTNIFQSGTYDMYYYQYGKWHGSFLVQLEFQNRNVQGSGTDDVGSYDITGNYSRSDFHLDLIKQYKPKTGNPHENLGHQVTINLKWNDQEHQFDGQWIVKTTNYSGQDKFKLKLRQFTKIV